VTRRYLLYTVLGPPILQGVCSASDAAVTSIEESDLDGFTSYPESVKTLVRKSLALTRMKLTYTFASADPKRGGMDCSGAIYHVLQTSGYKNVPRQSDAIALWLRDSGTLHRTQNVRALTDPAFASLRPGDLIFWSGTYDAKNRSIPVTHVMMYLGKLKNGGNPVLFGASDRRRYESQRRKVVSVFDFAIPKASSDARVYGYGRIPGLRR